VRESEMKVTLNATETGELIRKQLPKVFRRAGQDAALNVRGWL